MTEWQDSFPRQVTYCEICDQWRECAFIVDPYDEYMYSESLEKWLCQECYNDLWDMIDES